jgi:hypothetical protein
LTTLFPEIEAPPADDGPRVYNKRHKNVPADAVYIGRPSAYGNPYTMATEGDRDTVCAEFEVYARGRLGYDPDWLLPLKGLVTETR